MFMDFPSTREDKRLIVRTSGIWVPWRVPEDISRIAILCIGGGGGGGGGGASAAGVAAGAGGGGGSGQVVMGVTGVNAHLFAGRTLWVFVGAAGSAGTGQVQGGAASTSGTAGGASYVACGSAPSTNVAALVFTASGGALGNRGNGATSGAISGAVAALTESSALYSSYFEARTFGASNRGVAGSATAGANSNLTATLYCSGGAGGGAVTAGAAVTSGGSVDWSLPDLWPPVLGGAASAAGGDGRDWTPGGGGLWGSMPGAGGGGATGTASIAGAGGVGGAFGSGGGGGGGGQGTGARGGAGGAGAQGLVMIICF